VKRSEAFLKIRADIKLNPDVHLQSNRFQRGEISWGRFTDFLAEAALNSVLENVKMIPPPSLKPVPFEDDGKQYPLVPGDIKNENGVWCTPGYHGWEPEDEAE
jgi:hypothetical protein